MGGAATRTMNHNQFEDMMCDLVEEWHNLPHDDVPLHEWLGWTWEEYGAWVELKVMTVLRVRGLM